jgi:hypothetical protein
MRTDNRGQKLAEVLNGNRPPIFEDLEEQTGQKMFNSSRQSPPNPRYTRSPPNNSALLEQIKNLVYRRYAGDTSRVFMAFNLNR